MTEPTTARFEQHLADVLDRAYAAAWRFTGNATDAADLVQDSALLAWRHFDQFREGSNFAAWFLRILHNRFVSDYRRARRQGTPVAVEDVSPVLLWERSRAAGLHEGSDDPAGELLARLDADRIEAAINQLPDDYREVAILYFLRDLSYQDIATILEVPLGTVRSRLHRGRARLQQALWDVAEAHGLVPPGAAAGGGTDAGT